MNTLVQHPYETNLFIMIYLDRIFKTFLYSNEHLFVRLILPWIFTSYGFCGIFIIHDMSGKYVGYIILVDRKKITVFKN